jgi:hypothetical protein
MDGGRAYNDCICIGMRKSIMRPDGTRVKDLPPLVAAIPYIMPKRYDA